MRRFRRVLSTIFITSLILILVACSPTKDLKDLGLVTAQKSDEQAITEVVTYYFEQINNYSWQDYKKEQGMVVWLENEKNEELTNPNKLPNLEKSIKDNQISRKLQDMTISEVKIDGATAVIQASTEVSSQSTNERFNGMIRSSDTLTLQKVDNQWFIKSHEAQNVLSQAK